MLEKFHDGNLAFKAIWDGLISSSGEAGRHLCALNQVGQALSTRALGNRSRDDLDSTILISVSVPDHAYSRATAFSNCSTELPVSDVSLASHAGRGRRGGRDCRVALGVACIIVRNSREVFILWRDRVFIVADCKVTVGLQRLIVWQTRGCFALGLLVLDMTLRERWRVDSILQLK